MTDPTFYKLSEWHQEGTMMIDPSLIQSPRSETDQASSEGRKSNAKTKTFRKPYQRTDYARIVDTGKALLAITSARDGTWQHAMIPETEDTSVQSVTDSSNPSPSHSSSPSSPTAVTVKNGRRGRYVSKCQTCKAETYLRVLGMCHPCYAIARARKKGVLPKSK